MAINKEGNGYTFGFAITMVVVVGAILAGVAMATKPFKDRNDEVKKKMNIVKALLPEEEKAKISRKNAEEEFAKYIDLNDAVVIDMNGKVKEGVNAFDVDIRKEHRDKTLSEADKNYPLYIAKMSDGSNAYVIPVVGKGLWGPIWGNICLGSDMNTITGATFDHKGETPGLGAEIKQAFFINGWIGEKVADENGDFQKFEVVKDKTGTNEKKVDGITGGTITSKGVEEMINRCLQPYMLYFKNLKN